jgi:hypothetical protein
MWEEIFILPVDPLMNFIRSLITENVRIDVFKNGWLVINYVLSMFYVLLFAYSGFKFMTSGHDVVKRDKAKEFLKNVFILIISLQASFYIYDLLISIGSGLSSGIFQMINSSFFEIKVDLEYFLLSFPYSLTLLFTSILLIIRYAIVCIGVMILPIGLFLYFIEPLKQYGEMILGFLLTNIFINFFVSIIILGFSKLADLPVFENFQVLLITGCFLLVDVVIIYFSYFTILKSAFNTGSKVVGIVAKYVV